MNETANESSSEYKPDFVFGGNRKISEENWLEHEAQGVHNLVESMPEEDEEALREELAMDIIMGQRTSYSGMPLMWKLVGH